MMTYWTNFARYGDPNGASGSLDWPQYTSYTKNVLRFLTPMNKVCVCMCVYVHVRVCVCVCTCVFVFVAFHSFCLQVYSCVYVCVLYLDHSHAIILRV